jgi:hypothetical protein
MVFRIGLVNAHAKGDISSSLKVTCLGLGTWKTLQLESLAWLALYTKSTTFLNVAPDKEFLCTFLGDF